MADDITTPLTDAERANFETLRQAFARDDVALVRSVDRRTGETVALLCAMWPAGDAMTHVTPFAVMAGEPGRYVDPTAEEVMFGGIAVEAGGEAEEGH